MSRPSEAVVNFSPLDGQMSLVGPEGLEFRPPFNKARMKDGTRIAKTDVNVGLRIDPSNLPTKMVVDRNTDIEEEKVTKLADVHTFNSVFLVSDRFRTVVEALEPNKHQFEAVAVYWENGNLLGQFYWFFVIARIDSCDREKTTHNWNDDIARWSTLNHGKFVFSADKIGDNLIWMDAHRIASLQTPLVSEPFRNAMETADITGLRFHEHETTE